MFQITLLSIISVLKCTILIPRKQITKRYPLSINIKSYDCKMELVPLIPSCNLLTVSAKYEKWSYYS